MTGSGDKAVMDRRDQEYRGWAMEQARRTSFFFFFGGLGGARPS